MEGQTKRLDGPGGCTDMTTTNAHGLYRFRNLGKGTYTVIPSKAGCTFAPPDRTVTIMGRGTLARFFGTCP